MEAPENVKKTPSILRGSELKCES